MRLLLPTLLLLVTGCAGVTPAQNDAICAGTRAARADLAATLAKTPDDAAVIDGARLIKLIDAGCGK